MRRSFLRTARSLRFDEREAGISRPHAAETGGEWGVSVGRDDTTVLIVLTVRAIAKQVRIIANVQEAENIKLVRAGGADEIVAPSKFGGYLMADAVDTDGTIAFISDLLTHDGGCRLVERAPKPAEVGQRARDIDGTLIVEVRRGGQRMTCWNNRALVIEADDRLLAIDGNRP